MTNLQNRDMLINEASIAYNKIEAAYEAGDFNEAVELNNLYERLTQEAIKAESEL